MYIFNRVTVVPQLPERINKLAEVSNNLWWSWNSEFLRLFKMMDLDLWEKSEKNPVKFLKMISQEKIEGLVHNEEFLKEYDKVVENFDNYMKSKDTWFSKKYPNNKEDLRHRLGNILVAYDLDGKPVYAKELEVVGAMMALLKDILKPNLVQTVEETPCIVHLGPFANIAHGCNSIVATKLGLKLADYCVVEAGFGSDLGAEKFMDIKCRKAELKPDLSIIVATVKALKYNGYMPIEEIKQKNMDYLEKGIVNLGKHIENMKKYNVPVMVCINKFDTDDEEEIQYIKNYALKYDVPVEISEAFAKGSEGTVDFANKVVEMLENCKSNYAPLYNLNLTIEEKIEKICKEIYGAASVEFLDDAKENIKNAVEYGYSDLPVCIAKTPASLTDDAKILGKPSDFTIKIRDIKINSGAGFIVAYAGNIMTLPGLGKNSRYKDFR